jgi:hypothetical protein
MVLLPDQMQVVNPILILVMIFIFEVDFLRFYLASSGERKLEARKLEV